MRYLLLASLIFISPFLSAQSTDKTADDEKVGILLRQALSFGFQLNTNGWGIFGSYSRNTGIDRYRLIEVEFLEMKHPKEHKQSNDFGISFLGYSPKPFVFGKQNNFFALHAGYGAKRQIGDKAEKSGVEVTISYILGPTVGFLKPYYLDVIDVGDGQQEPKPIAMKYEPETAALFLNPNLVYGASGFGHGLDEIKFYPGIYGKAGLNFDWAGYDEFVKALEVGVSLDVYPRNIPIMITERNKPFFLYLYASIEFGKKW